MKNMMKKALIFALVALIAKPAYPVFGVSAVSSTLSRWGMGALSGMVNGAKNHPWLTGAAVSAVALGAGALYWYKKTQNRSHEEIIVDYQSLLDITKIIDSRAKVAEPTRPYKVPTEPLPVKATTDSVVGFYEKRETKEKQLNKQMYFSGGYESLNSLIDTVIRLFGGQSLLCNAKLHYVINTNGLTQKNNEMLHSIREMHNNFKETFLEKAQDTFSSSQLNDSNVNGFVESVLVDSLDKTKINHLFDATLVLVRKDEQNDTIMHYMYEKKPSIVICTPTKNGKSWQLSELQKNGWGTRPNYYTGSCKLPEKSLVITMSNNVKITDERVLGRADDFIKAHNKKKNGEISQKSMNKLAEWIMNIATVNEGEEAFVSVMYV